MVFLDVTLARLNHRADRFPGFLEGPTYVCYLMLKSQSFTLKMNLLILGGIERGVLDQVLTSQRAEPLQRQVNIALVGHSQTMLERLGLRRK